QDTGENKAGEPIAGEFPGILNYSIMALIKHAHSEELEFDTPAEKLMEWYDEQVTNIKALLDKKNHDYGEAWRELRISSMSDLMKGKLLRIRQIERNKGKTIVSEPPEAGFMDIANYAIFCLIRISEKADPMD